MRTTVTLDPDNAAAIRKLMSERGLSFKEAVNESLRAALAPRRSAKRFRTTTFAMGKPAVPIDKALRLAAELEDE